MNVWYIFYGSKLLSFKLPSETVRVQISPHSVLSILLSSALQLHPLNLIFDHSFLELGKPNKISISMEHSL
jgi:hypothetical protein